MTAQETVLTGTVTDGASGEPVLTIYVEVVGTRISTLTDRAGRWILPNLEAGTWTLRFSWLGYESREIDVTLTAGQSRTVDVQMVSRPIPIGEIRVESVSRQPERVVESPAAVATVSPGRIRDMAGTDQAPLLVADLPGVQVQQNGVNNFIVNSRSFSGLANRRLLVLVDGRDVAANFGLRPFS